MCVCVLTFLALRTLRLISVNLYGTLPESLGNLQSLIELWIVDTFVNGTIPSVYGTGMSKLRFFVVSNNLLTGTIPSSLGDTQPIVMFDGEYLFFFLNLFILCCFVLKVSLCFV